MSDLTQIFGGAPFDPQTVEPAKEWEPVPPGLHPVLIRKAFMKPTKAGTGNYLQVEMDIVDGPAKGRKLIDRLNLDNPNKEAVTIAAKTLSALCRATEIIALSTDDQFVNQTTIALVKVDKENQNGITTYLTPQKAAEYTAKKASTPTIAGPPPATRVTPVQQPVQPPPVQQAVVQQPIQQPVVQPVQQPPAANPFGNPAATPSAQVGPPAAGDSQQTAPAGQPIWMQGK